MPLDRLLLLSPAKSSHGTLAVNLDIQWLKIFEMMYELLISLHFVISLC